MKLKSTIITSVLLATVTIAGIANANEERMCGSEKHGKHHEKMEAKMAEHQAKLKTTLKITPAQEKAFSEFAQSMKPELKPVLSKEACEAKKAESTSLNAVQRMEKHLAHVDEKRADMATRLTALKTFYAQLSPEQQKLFDAHAKERHEKRAGKMDKVREKLHLN